MNNSDLNAQWLKQSGVGLLELLEASINGMLIVSPLRISTGQVEDFTVVAANKAAGSLLQRPDEPLAGQKLTSLLQGRQNDLYKWCVVVAESPLSFSGEQHLRLGEEEFIYDVNISRLLEEVLITLTDVTHKRRQQLTTLAERSERERQATEEKLRRTEKLMEKFAELTPSLISVQHRESGQYLYVNKAWKQMLGYEESELLEGGSEFAVSIFHPDDLARLLAEQKAADAHIAATGIKPAPETIQHQEFRVRHKDGSYIWLSTLTTALDVNAAGEIEHTITAAVDITEKKKAEEELQRMNAELEQRVRDRTAALEQSRQELNLIINAVPDLISYVDKEYRYRFLNKGYMTWFGPEAAEWTGMKLEDVLGEEPFENSKPYFDRALSGEPVTYDAQYTYKNGVSKYINARYVPDKDAQGNVRGIVTLVLDTTSLVKAQEATRVKAEELERKNRDLMRLNADLDNFIYMASHDLKAPISNIEGLIGMLQEIASPETLASAEFRQVMQFMRESIARFQHTVRELSSLTRAVYAPTEDTEEIRLTELTKEIQLDLTSEIAASSARIELDYTCPTVRFSHQKLRSVLFNLVSNAIKYRHPERLPVVRIICRQEGQEIHLTVADNGLGIPPAKQQEVFFMFKRHHVHTQGAGLGLYLVRRVVENAGGRVQLQSEEGEGSVFTVILPAAVQSRAMHQEPAME